MAITINGTLSLDESAGLQVGGVAVGDEDNNDSDVTLATLLSEQSAFYNRLFAAVGDGGLALPTTFASSVSVAKSADDFISVENGTVTSLGFVDGSGNPLPVYGGADPGVATGLTTIDGEAIVLFADATLGDRLVLGVDESGEIVFAIYMDPSNDLTTAQVWMVQLEPITNGDDSDHDDPEDLFDSIGVAAGSNLEFTFDTLPSGSNLFGVVGDPDTGLIIIGKDIALKGDGTYISNQTQEVKTSQAGPNATIGIESQMFDPGDAAYFTFVHDPNTDYLGLNLGSTEADDADNISYGSTLEGDSAFVRIAQLQGSTPPSMSIQCFNIEDAPQGRDFIGEKGQNDPNEAVPKITDVRVYDADDNLIESYLVPDNSNGLTITINADGVATVTGFGEYYRIEWDTDEKFDQVLISGVAGKFDIGGFGLTEAITTSVDIGDKLIFEDDGPAVDLELRGTAELVVDETDIPAATDSITADDLFSTNTADFGTDGAGTDDSVYELVLGNTDSGLYDTATGDEVILSINGAGTVITGEVSEGGGDVTVFTIEIDPDTGEVTLTQSRAMINGDPDDPDEDDTPLTLGLGTVSVRRTITDADDDSDSDEVDISAIFKFEDDGPDLGPPESDGLELLTDDSDIEDSAALELNVIFPSAIDYGEDGPHPDTPVDYVLSLAEENGVTALFDTETEMPILLVTVGDDVVGYVDENDDGVIGLTETLEAIRYSIGPVPGDPDAEQVNFTQKRAVFHDTALPETVGAELVFVDQVATDGDGDTVSSESVDLGAITFIQDDEPEIGPVANSIVDFVENDTANEDLNGDVGKDPNSSPYTLTSYTTNLTVNGVDLEGVLAGDGKSVTYYADSDDSGTFGDGTDVAYYRLELGDQVGEGDYTFTVLVDPPPAFTEFTFEDLPSGSNLFGIVGEGNAGLIVFGQAIGLKADNTYIANQTQEIKTSQAGPNVTIGIESQMFDPGDAAYFTFVNNPNADFTGLNLGSTEADDADNILYGSTLEGDSAFVRIAQLQGNAAPSMSIAVFNIEDSPQGVNMINTRGDNEAGKDPDVIAVRVYDAAGNLLEDTGDLANYDDPDIEVIFDDGVATVSGFGDGYLIAWDADEDFDQTLITGVAGKFDIGGFGFFQGNDTPDQVLDFTARVTDGDDDYAEASWKVGIDGTGDFDDGLVEGVSII